MCSVTKKFTEKIPFTTFLKRARSVHNDLYEYIEESYNGTSYPITIVCPIHGEFIQHASSHLKGCGCPKCQNSKLEIQIRTLLEKNNINYIPQMNDFNWLKSKKGNSQSLDFYLPDYNIAIECQGEQHFMPVDFANRGEKWANERFLLIQKLDENKKQLCKENNVKLLYFSHTQYNSEIITDEEALLNKIKKIIC